MSSTEKANNRIVFIITSALVFVYSAVSALSLFMNGDDYVWYSIPDYPSLDSFRNPNGRYFSNFMTLYLARYSVLRVVFVLVTLALLILLIARLIAWENKKNVFTILFSLSAITLIPSSTYRETICWISGFTNYVFTPVLVLTCLIICFDVLYSERNFKPYCLFLFPAIAFIAGLSVEHYAIYDVLLGAAFIVILKLKRKKFFITPFLFLGSSLIALYLMFTNKIYSSISEGNDYLGNRRFQFDFSDLFMNTIRFVIPNYIKSFWIINIVIAVSVFIIYIKRRPIKSKYAPICLCIVELYSIYSVFCSVYSDLALLTPAMKIRGFETAFSFLYVVSLAYFIWLFFDKDKRIRYYVYLLSTVLLTGPFMFINPCTPRCFMGDYIFWIILAGELFFSALSLLKCTDNKLIAVIGLSVTTCLTAFILNIEVSNCYYAYRRFDFIKEQLNSGKTNNILVVDYPYPEYNDDDLYYRSMFEKDVGDGLSYFMLMGHYYGFDGAGCQYQDLTHINTIDYHLYKESD